MQIGGVLGPISDIFYSESININGGPDRAGRGRVLFRSTRCRSTSHVQGNGSHVVESLSLIQSINANTISFRVIMGIRCHLKAAALPSHAHFPRLINTSASAAPCRPHHPSTAFFLPSSSTTWPLDSPALPPGGGGAADLRGRRRERQRRRRRQ